MQKSFKHLALLALFVSPLAMAQALQGQEPAAPATVAVAPPDAAKKSAIADLLKAIDGEKLAGAIGNSAQMQAKQLVPAILSDALSENKTLNDKQKQAAVAELQDALQEQANKAHIGRQQLEQQLATKISRYKARLRKERQLASGQLAAQRIEMEQQFSANTQEEAHVRVDLTSSLEELNLLKTAVHEKDTVILDVKARLAVTERKRNRVHTENEQEMLSIESRLEQDLEVSPLSNLQKRRSGI